MNIVQNDKLLYIIYYIMLILVLVIVLIIDFIYLSLSYKPFISMIQIVQQDDVIEYNYIAAMMTYFLLAFAIDYFIIKNNKNEIDAMILGIIIYGVYDLTNMALLKNWNYNIALQDILWGGVLFYITTIIYYRINYYL